MAHKPAGDRLADGCNRGSTQGAAIVPLINVAVASATTAGSQENETIMWKRLAAAVLVLTMSAVTTAR
jgi:hypothetical protein